MSESAPPTYSDVTTSAIVPVLFPELVLLIGHYLHQQDLLRCVQVCQSWNQILIPQLWRTIDTDQSAWRRIFEDTVLEAKRPKAETEAWIKDVFAKYGHHIRHLSTWSCVILEATLNNSCTQLSTLSVSHIYQQWQWDAISPLPAAAPPPAPVLPWICPVTKERDEIMANRNTMERIWVLFQQNPGLVHIDLPYDSFSCMGVLPETFILGTLSSMKYLRELALEWVSLDAEAFLDAVPQLEVLEAFKLRDLDMMQKDHNNLRSLYIPCDVEVDKLFRILDRLPGLESFRSNRVTFWDTGSSNSTMKALSVTESTLQFRSVKRLQVTDLCWGDDKAIAMLVRRLPELLWVGLPKFCETYEEIKKALWETCYYLDEFGGEVYERWADEWRRRRAKDEEN
ncbi:hypothetical protein BGZ91_002356 [Linnemannia elongata]|nr:hypothetical protein BGZ91_002356 [Linnemannia elongata]